MIKKVGIRAITLNPTAVGDREPGPHVALAEISGGKIGRAEVRFLSLTEALLFIASQEAGFISFREMVSGADGTSLVSEVVLTRSGQSRVAVGIYGAGLNTEHGELRLDRSSVVPLDLAADGGDDVLELHIDLAFSEEDPTT